jgi:hypothetical protein
MSLPDVLQILFWVAVSLVIGWWVVFGYWRIRSEITRRSEGDAPLRSSRTLIWRDPGSISVEDLEAGPCGKHGAPAPPFHFVEEHDTGSQPCVSIRDGAGRDWRVKWGQEVHTETFGTRLAWALGYFAEPTYFLPSGTIEGTSELRRAKACIDAEHRFTDARFELSEPNVKRHFDAHGWAWHDNPFVGSHELNGLKILMMLISNWDNKDVRDVARGSNTAIFEYELEGHQREARYLIIDWGAALGAWGSNIVQRGRWDAEAYAAQNELFVTGVDGDLVKWGYQGQRTTDITYDITVDDVRWFYQLAGALGDEQLRAAFRASGATAEEVERFTAGMRGRLEKLREVAEGSRSAKPQQQQPAP